MHTKYDRDKLYNEIWKKPMTTVAASYGISDVALNKMCKKLNVPTPGKGYWQKVRAGAKIDRPPLPEDKGTRLARGGSTRAYETYRQRQQAVNTTVQPVKSKNVVVSAHLRAPHPLVKQAFEKFQSVWSYSREKDPVIHLKKDTLDIRVSKSSAERALRIMDALIKALVNEGYALGFDNGWNRTYVRIDGAEIYFKLSEHVKQVPHVKTDDELKRERKGQYVYAPTYDYIPTGVLTLSIDYYGYLPKKNWTDREKRKLEDCLDEFIDGLKAAAAHSQIKIAEQRETERMRQEIEEQKRMAAELRANELAKLEELERRAALWRRSQLIKQYIDAMEASIHGAKSDNEAADFREYITWARGKIDWLNPLIAKEDAILGRRDR